MPTPASLLRNLKFSGSNPHSNLDMICAMESVVPKFSQTLGMGFMWKIRSMLEKCKSSRPNMTVNEFESVKYVWLDKDIRIFQADKGKWTDVLDESK
jgi:hypothetical protein